MLRESRFEFPGVHSPIQFRGEAFRNRTSLRDHMCGLFSPCKVRSDGLRWWVHKVNGDVFSFHWVIRDRVWHLVDKEF